MHSPRITSGAEDLIQGFIGEVIICIGLTFFYIIYILVLRFQCSVCCTASPLDKTNKRCTMPPVLHSQAYSVVFVLLTQI